MANHQVFLIRLFEQCCQPAALVNSHITEIVPHSSHQTFSCVEYSNIAAQQKSLTMTDAAAVRAFIDHWERVERNEKAVAQSHFNGLCHLLSLKGPVKADPEGQLFRFVRPLSKSGSGRLSDRILTNLYNRRLDWLTEAHKRLDAAVFNAYGWPHPSTGSGQAMSDDEILARLLALNLERAAG